MKKIILPIALFLGLNCSAQDYYHAIGGGYNIGLFNLAYESPDISLSSTEALGCPVIFYKATLAFEVSRSSSFAISAYPGFGGIVSSRYGSYVTYQLPVMGEFYFGDVDDANFNVGAGFSYSAVGGGKVMGPQIGIGGQFEFRDQIIGLRGSYTLGINKSDDIPSGATVSKDTKSMIGLTVHYLLGQ